MSGIMKTLNRYFAITALAAPLLLTACVDNDVYDPDKVRPVPPVNNPLGDDFVAPDGFDWSMISTVNLNIEVKDELNGQYNYLAEVFTTNPLLDNAATPIAAGYAKSGSNYVAEISIPKSIKRLFIRQTDPKNRNEIYEYAVPEKGGTLNCMLYFSATQTRALNASGTSGWEHINGQVKEYNEEQPTAIGQLSENFEFEAGTSDQLTNGSVYIIKPGETFNGNLTNYQTKSTVIVKGTWNMNSTPQGLDIYVTEGGKITGNPFIGNRCTLEIQENSSIDCQSFTTETNIPVRNFGTFKVSGITKFNTSSSLYNGKDAIFAVSDFDFSQARSTVKNFGSFSAKNANNLNSCVIYNAEAATFTLEQNMDVTSTQVLNHGVMKIGGTIQTNSNLDCFIVNYNTGTIIANSLIGGAITINDNHFEVNTFDYDNDTDAILYNNCTFIAKQAFKFTQLVLDNGSITGARNNDEWESVAVTSYNEGSVTLKNGSIIKATNFDCGSNLDINAGTDTPSMIQAESIKYNWTTKLKGKLILAVNNEINAGPASWDAQYTKESSVKLTKRDEAKETIETCSGIIYPGNPGEPDPEDPEKPTIEDNTVYTYAFEDQWPAYGDFDMNDVVVSIDKMTATEENKKFTIKGRVRAVGSSHKTGIGIQFLNVSNSGVVLSGKVQNGTPAFESGQSNPVIILSTNAHKYCNPNIAEDDFTFYSTTPSGNNNGDGAEFEIIMAFPTAEEALKAMNVKNLDVFIISKEAQAGVKRTEVHMANYAPTALGTTALFGMSNDASADNSMLNVPRKGYYISTEGLAWSICIPNTEVWKWPKEYIMITDVYPGFKSWVVNGGKTEDLDWISNHNNDIYVKP